MKEIKILTTIKEFDSYLELDNEAIDLITAAKTVTKSSYAPYSKFNVGAAVLLANGEILTGSNQENAAYPSGLCAERVVIFYANSKYPDIPVKAIAISSSVNSVLIEEAVPPCGACRQVMIETENRYKTPIKIYLAGKDKVRVIENANQLLPMSFDGEFLK